MIERNSSSWLEGKKLYRVNKDGTTGDVDMMIRNNRRGAAMLLYFLTFLQWILYTKWVRLMVFTSRISNNLSKTMNAAGFLMRHYLKPGLCRYEDMRAGFNYRFNDRRRKDRYTEAGQTKESPNGEEGSGCLKEPGSFFRTTMNGSRRP